MEKSPLPKFSLAVLPLLVFAFGCSIIDPSPPTVPNGAVPLLFVPANYEAWFAKTVKCSGVDGRMEPIEWFVVPNVSQFATSNGEKVGMWERRGNHVRIVIAGSYLQHEMVIRHEMLHHLLDAAGHPPEYFSTRCHLTWASWDGGTGQGSGMPIGD